MVSASSASDSSSNKFTEEQGKEAIWTLPSKLTELKKQIQSSRLDSIREKLEKNGRNLQFHTSQVFELAVAAPKKSSSSDESESKNMLSFRIGSPLCKINGPESSLPGWGEKESVNSQEEILSSATLVFGSNGGGKCGVRLIKLPYVEKIPSYTTWIFLDRNQRMAEDQSVVGRRRIYYDQYGSEALICSDSDEEIAEPDEEKHGFSEGEDQILWTAIQEHGLNQEVLNIVNQFVEASTCEIEERYETLIEKRQEKHVKNSEASGEVVSEGRLFLDKTLSAALDSFDNLFCRRCLIFDCRLHGCSQSPIIPSEKQSFGFDLEENRNPCGDQCYLRRREVQYLCHDMPGTKVIHKMESVSLTEKLGTTLSSESEGSNPGDDSINPAASEGMSIDVDRPVIVQSETTETDQLQNLGVGLDTDMTVPEVSSKNIGKRKLLKHENMPKGKTKPATEKCPGSADKKQKKLSASDVAEDLLDMHLVSVTNTKSSESGALGSDLLQKKPINESIECPSRNDICPGKSSNTLEDVTNNAMEVPITKNSSDSSKGQGAHDWNAIEKDLYLKGIEIFGKNSCLIARNLLSGLKTCMEVSKYMFDNGAALPTRPVLTNSCFEDSGKADHDYTEQEMQTRTRIWRRRGRARKLKYTWKSAGHPSFRKRIADGKQQSCKQYAPCGCQLMCGKQCPCLHNGTCCEKYCGCSKSCKNRFRGCHCAKSQCRSRQCPCFAAGRECDPDVCRNCWVSCGDGSLGEPPARGDGYQCGNMKLLLKQQQRILLARSDVAGWGAFIKNPVNKNDYLGEYTGELISHKEADKRGKIYDRANSSFLFDLNDQYVLDAYRKGDKLKFANHSSNPNCYAKVMLVAGDHRVGIFAKEHIEATEELFYDYRYGPDQAPVWARKPEGSKRDDSSVSHGRAQKIA